MEIIERKLIERVAVDPEICDGKPFVRGTRISVAVILDALAQGLSAEQIVELYPMLELEDVEGALAFATELAERNSGLAMVGRRRGDVSLLQLENDMAQRED